MTSSSNVHRRTVNSNKNMRLWLSNVLRADREVDIVRNACCPEMNSALIDRDRVGSDEQRHWSWCEDTQWGVIVLCRRDRDMWEHTTKTWHSVAILVNRLHGVMDYAFRVLEPCTGRATRRPGPARTGRASAWNLQILTGRAGPESVGPSRPVVVLTFSCFKL